MEKKKIVIVLSMLMLMLAPLSAQAQSAPAADMPILAVKFHADWCGSCKQMGSVLSDLQNKFDQKNVLFVELDFTNATTSHRSHLLAKSLGIHEIVEANEGTGFILLLDKEGGVKERFTKQNTIKEISKSIQESLQA